MKKMENSFAVTGFVGKDASIHQFTTASVARFSLAISRNEKNGDENSRTSAFMNVEAWRKNENTSSFDRLVKGALFLCLYFYVILIILLHFNTLLKRCKTVNNQQIYNRFFYFMLILFLAERIVLL